MVKVAMVVWNDFRNDARVLKEAETLSAKGYSVTVFAVHFPGLTQERERVSNGIEVVRVQLNPFRKLAGKARGQGAGKAPNGSGGGALGLVMSRVWGHLELMWRMVRLRPDVVHAHDVNTLPTAWLAAKLSRAPIIYDAHEISSSREGYATFRKLVSWIECFLMPRIQGAITTTDVRAKFFARTYGVDRPTVLQNRPRKQSINGSSRLREELGLQMPWPIVLYQGGLQPGRGLEGLVRAAAAVPGAYFVFVGAGKLGGVLRDIVASLELENRVYFIPTVPLSDLPSYTESADIGVQPIENTCLNHYSTDSNKLFEYVQAGLPVVASDLPEIRRVVRTHDLGLLVPAGDLEALAAALRDLVGDEGKRRHFARCSEVASSVLNWEDQEHKLLDLYAGVTGVVQQG